MDISKLTLEEKAGQLVMCGFAGTEPSEEVLRLIGERHIGGVIYFARNVRDVRQIAELSDNLQEAARQAGLPPLFVMIDQEGGMVARITEGVALMPGAMALGAGSTPEEAYESARICGEELRALGVNLNFAPVLDVNNNPRNPVIGVRSFGESPERVASYGEAALRGLQAAGVVATAKHFPGHGDTEVDSHLDLPTVPHGRERIFEVELQPFIRAIGAEVDSIMSSHVVFPAFEPQRLPVTLSHHVLTGLLREELGYEGVIFTDCMEMHAISKHYGTVEACVMAIEAGADAVLVSHSFELQTGAIDAIVEAVRSGRLTEERLDASVSRLLALKKKRGIGAETRSLEERLAGVGTAAHLEAAKRWSEASVTVVKQEADLLPLAAGEETLVLSVQPAVVTLVDDALAVPLTLGKALEACGVQVREQAIPLADVARMSGEALEMAASYERIVVATYNACFDDAQALLVRELLARGKRPIVVATRMPYDLLAFPAVPVYVCLYESRPLALQSAAKVLAGQLPARGRLPVSLSGEFPAGWGVQGDA
ncbi:beta-N-acetylhexosaminidase [Paenibacillus aurantius]|uniref:Beta-N-acetylhexosaminidase n=1 Tax=Paenibacillus aurantius TaxID=2918900 RepID=A0AA96RG65_9BACL|nr:beta-N-acetylhexosaminidase [Paenibacillus aurantius]WNQ11998.1 beta-N-acetylhexosaminidase [Paenibacillus aurantius]